MLQNQFKSSEKCSAVLLDLAKAFDTGPLALLFQKFKNIILVTENTTIILVIGKRYTTKVPF